MREAMETNKLRSVYDRVAKHYDFQHGFLTAKSDQRGRELLVEKAVCLGDHVLDCGAGTGITGLMAAERVGHEGNVVLFDMSEGMLAVAKDKVVRADLQERIEFKVGDMLELPFEDDRFDAVLSTYSLCPVYDPAKGADEMYRVTKPGGRIGIADSTEPENPWVKWLADRVEGVVWHIPSIFAGLPISHGSADPRTPRGGDHLSKTHRRSILAI